MLQNQHIARQLDLVPEEILDTPVTIIGAGAIGSWTTIALAKMGFTDITVWDHDNVNIVNMSSQFYMQDDVDFPKVHCLAKNVSAFTEEESIVHPKENKFDYSKLTGVVVMAVDSMQVRKEIYESQKLNLGCKWIIDARMGSEMALLYTIDPNNNEDQVFYEKTLYTDSEAVQEPCTAKSTTYCALVLSGIVTKTVRDVLVKHKYLRNLAFSLKESDFLAYCKDLRQ